MVLSLGIEGIKDLARRDIRFINRNDGSGTRYILRLSVANAGLTPATQIKVSGCSGMALAHSRGTSCAANHRRGDSFGTQCRYEPSLNILNVFLTISCFLHPSRGY
ncbi:MAG TPA: hypothetical protein ENF28_03355 [Proteobacteria bacterium]|nr:hypothetical protein [Pseudomonadota bacterium]